ncbi:MAG TPA: ABC transporter permease [Candidatus Dormibacteraeota bacterium]|nr:ABC transporter permease [Candidatus Dormibacteraeota bacterium]
MTATALRHELGAFVGFLERQRDLYRRFWAWEVVWFVYSLVSVMSIGYLATGLEAAGATGVDLRATQLYLLAGSMLWSYLSLVFMEVAYAVGWERWEGTIEYTFMAPVKRATHLLGICAFSVLYGLARTAVVVVVALLVFHVDLSHADLLAAAVVLAAATVPLIGLGILIAILPLLAPEKGEQMSTALQGLFLLVSGVYYPVSVLPLPLQAVGVLSPLTYTLSAIRDALLHHASVAAVLPATGLLLLMGAVLIPVALWLFSRAERRAKRLGTLKRSG